MSHGPAMMVSLPQPLASAVVRGVVRALGMSWRGVSSRRVAVQAYDPDAMDNVCAANAHAVELAYEALGEECPLPRGCVVGWAERISCVPRGDFAAGCLPEGLPGAFPGEGAFVWLFHGGVVDLGEECIPCGRVADLVAAPEEVQEVFAMPDWRMS